MTDDTVNQDENGIPVLDNPLDLDRIDGRTTAGPLPDLTDHELVARLLQNAAVQNVLDDMSEDLQKLASWKIEELLKEQFTLLIRQAAAESAPKLAEDIRTQLQLALPGLLADMLALARKNGQPG